MKRKVLAYEMVGFLLIALMIWADEIFDLPHLILGAPPTPVNWKECVAESTFVLLFGVIIYVFTTRLLARVRHLEGSIPVCTFCRRVQIYTGWITMEDYVKQFSDADVDIAMCPACAAERYNISFKSAK
jgi:hypothetical protein